MRKTYGLIAMLMAAAMLSACAAPSVAPELPGEVEVRPPLTIEELQTSGTSFTDRDLKGTWDDAAATHITLDDAPVIDGEGAAVTAAGLRLTSEGVYVLTGQLRGQIVVEAQKDDKLQIVLNGASITSPSGPAIYIKTADKVFLTIAANTNNAIADSVSDLLDAEEADGAIYSKADLTINGTGNLNITGTYKHGVVSKDDLVLADAAIGVTAAGDGLRGKDCIKVHEARLVIDAQGDGMQSNHTGDKNIGYVLLSGGTYDITAGEDGIQAETRLHTSGGTFHIVTGGGSAAAPAMTHTSAVGSRVDGGMTPPDAKTTDAAATPAPVPTPKADGASNGENAAPAEDTASAKGLKAGTDLVMEGGTFALDTLDDAVHANGEMTLHPEALAVTAGDDGIHAGGALRVDGGTISVSKSYEGMEGSSVTITDGVLTITAFDDGINAAGGTDASDPNERGGTNEFMPEPSRFIDIQGGTIHVNASGDGLDSNGDFTMSGGMLTVSGSEDAGNGALDYNGKGSISVGTIIAAGNAAMTQSFSEDAAQGVLTVYYTQTQAAGTSITLKSGENVLIAFAPEKAYNMAVISAPGMNVGQTYALYADNEKQADVTLDQIIMRINEKGEAVTGAQPNISDMQQPGGPAGGKAPNGEKGAKPDTSAKPEGTPPAGTMKEPPSGGMPPDGTFPFGDPPSGDPPSGAPSGKTPTT